MSKTLLVVERIVLESLQKGANTTYELEKDTLLNSNVINAVCDQLRQRGIIVYKKGEISIDWSSKKDWLPIVSDKQGSKAELTELFSSLVSRRFREKEDTKLSVKKVWLTKHEKEDLDRRLDDLDAFLESIKMQRKLRPVKEVTGEQHVLFYGSSIYRELVSELMLAS